MAIFQVSGVFLTSSTCIVKSRKKGCFHKSTTEKWLWGGNFTPFCARPNLRGFLLVRRNDKIIWLEQRNEVLILVMAEP